MLELLRVDAGPARARNMRQGAEPDHAYDPAPRASVAQPSQIGVESVARSLYEQGLSFRDIALQLGLYTSDARELCHPEEERVSAPPVRRPGRRSGRRPRSGLSRRALRVLLHGSHASVGGGENRDRMRHLPQIAASYRRAELLAEPGVGNATVAEIELWLASLGLHFLGIGSLRGGTDQVR